VHRAGNGARWNDNGTSTFRKNWPEKGGGIWVGARYGRGGERIPEPVKGLSHAATVTQVCRFYFRLATGRMISHERSREMLEIFSTHGLHDKFVSVMEKTVPLNRLYRKSGEWSIKQLTGSAKGRSSKACRSPRERLHGSPALSLPFRSGRIAPRSISAYRKEPPFRPSGTVRCSLSIYGS